jgi:hypothetical protein
MIGASSAASIVLAESLPSVENVGQKRPVPRSTPGRFAEQKVTHQTVTEVLSPSTSSLAPDIAAGREE